MEMNGLYLVIASALILVIAYRLYGSFVAAKVLTVNQYRTTPAVAINDGVDYVPTNKWVTFGQHFAAIAGAGPLVGPVIAAQFGYLPGVLWILIGSVLAGAVHDFVLLFASVRYNGKSIADIAKSEISSVAGMGTLLATLFLLIITMAGMAAVVANSLENSPWGFFTVSATIPIAVFIGIYLRWIRPGKIREATVIGVALIMAAVVYGPDIAHSSLAPYFTWDRKSIQIMLAVYSFFAAALPVWLLLAPRGYLSTYMKVGTIGALALGIILVMPVLQMPAFSDYVNGGGPVLSGSAVPFVFITIACGALSGFHATVSTGTTPKMITNEKEMLPIGYGAMLTEAFIAMMALIAATSLHPNDYFAINSTTETFSALGLQVQELPMLSQMVGEDLMHRPGGAVSLAVGMAHIFSKIPNMSHLMSYWYHFCIMFEALFILTLIDTGTRVSRYMVQELLGMAWPKMKDAHWLPGVYIASFLVCFTWGYLVLQGNIGTIWPLFGVSNQLLATMGLAIGTTVIMHLGHKRYAWVMMIPCFFIAIITVMADYQNVFGNYIPEGQWMLVGVSVVMFILVAVVMVEAVRSWIRLVKQPQDFRTEADIEEETLEDMEPENV
ncbi:carbon starvation protein A [Veillonella sp. KGMB01456]|uniref:carbon starvation CstA family protein n=1 Tax=Veillonella sp. KGMB01456 TaxID=2934794 RepID=UPI00248B0E37|nr:carbon starvation protein A [Veillonella sp. KGMB01456]